MTTATATNRNALRDNLAALCAGKQHAVAHGAGISSVHLNRTIKGHADCTFAVVCALADALSIDIKQLVS